MQDAREVGTSIQDSREELERRMHEWNGALGVYSVEVQRVLGGRRCRVWISGDRPEIVRLGLHFCDGRVSLAHLVEDRVALHDDVGIDLVVTIDEERFWLICEGELSPQRAYLEGALQVSGDPYLLITLIDWIERVQWGLSPRPRANT